MANFGIKNIWKNTNTGGNVDTTHLVTTNTNQTISGDKQFNGATQFNNYVEFHNNTTNDCSLAIDRANTKANYIAFFNGGDRLGYMGKNSANDTNFTIGSDLGDIRLIAHSNINCNSKRLINVADPNANTDCANKQYVDNNKYQSFTTIKNSVGNIGSVNSTSWTQILDYTNFENGFQMENQATYQVMLKQNISNRDIYATCTICVNNAQYDNSSITTPLYWDTNGIDSVMFWVIINNNRLKLYVRRFSGTTTNWNTTTRVYIKKVAQGGIE